MSIEIRRLMNLVETPEWKNEVKAISQVDVKAIDQTVNWNKKSEAMKGLSSLRDIIATLSRIVTSYEKLTTMDGFGTPVGAGLLVDLISEIENNFKPAVMSFSSLKEDANKDDYNVVIMKLNSVSHVIRSFMKKNQQAIERSKLAGTPFYELIVLIGRIPETIEKLTNKIENITMLTTK